MAEAPQNIQKRVLLPQLLSARAQFEIGGTPSGQFGAAARCQISLDNFPYWLLGVRIVNVVRLEGQNITLEVAAQLAQSRIEQLQEIRVSLGTYRYCDWTAQELVVGRDGVLWAPFPLKYASDGNVNIVIEARRLTGYPFDLVPELAATVVAAGVREGRPGATFQLNVG